MNQKDTEKRLKKPILFLPKYIAKSFVGREGAKIFTLFPSLHPNLKFESVSDWPYHSEASASKNSKERLKLKVMMELNTEDYIYFCCYYLYPFKLLLRMSH